MAKKPTKKPAKPAKKPAPKAAAKKPAAKGKPAGGGKGGVFPVSTGSGATPEQVGKTLVTMFNGGKLREIEDFYWTPDIVSCEGMGVGMEWRGQQAVREKNAEWGKGNKIVSARAEGPFVGSTGFAVKFAIEIEKIPGGTREKMNEVGVYTVRDGKICREEFMFAVG